MKRPSEEAEAVAQKKIKSVYHSLNVDSVGSDPLAFDITRQRRAADICERGTEEDGYVSFRIYMRWDKYPEKLGLQTESMVDGDVVRFDVFFEGPCLRYLRSIGFQFDFGDRVCLSLKGATIHRKSLSKASTQTLPMELVYSSGVRFKLERKKQVLPSIIVVDSWPCESNFPRINDKLLIILAQEQAKHEKPRISTGDAPFQDDWFSTPVDISLAQDAQAHTEASRKDDIMEEQPVQTESADHGKMAVEERNDGGVYSASAEPSSRQSSAAASEYASRRQSEPTDTLARPQKKLYRDTGPTRAKVNAQPPVPRKTPPSVATGSSDPSAASIHSARDNVPHGVSAPDDRIAKKGAKKAARAARKAALNDTDGQVKQTETVNALDSLPEAVVHVQELPSVVAPVAKTIIPSGLVPPMPTPPVIPPVMLPPNQGIPGKGEARVIDTDSHGVRLRV